LKWDDIYFGVDYYPEHWPGERWETDARLMKEAGFDAVRMAEFAWVKMEPELNRFCFEWLDDAITLFASYGLKVILGTPTATPPAWIIESAPEILPVNEKGGRLGFGGRHHDCQSNAEYRKHAVRIVTALAEHYKDNSAVIGWQIDNELGNSHEDLCMCESCRSKFHEWLIKKYITIENLNECWGTIFWSQTYSGFHQIPAPRITPNSHNPSLLLDWKRFCSDLIIEFQQLQIEIIHKICPNHFITHNFMSFFDKIDYFGLATNLDFIGYDQYPGGFWLKDSAFLPPFELAAGLDLMKGLKDKPFWIMEHQAGPAGWETLGPTPRPGQLRMWTSLSVARGADAVFYFRWRSCLFGTEQFWHGILPHSGIPGRRYDEIKKTISELRPVMSKLKGLKSQSNVAILFSYEQNWAIEIQPHHPDLDYIQQIKKYYAYFYDRNIAVDFISEESNFSKHSLIIAPLQFLTNERLVERFKTYVSNGGNLVLTMRTGVKDDNNVCLDSHLPGPFSDLLGIEILDYDCLRELSVQVSLDGKIAGTAQKWCDIISLKSAKAIAHYNGEYYKGVPAATVNALGAGQSYYIGFEPDDALMSNIMDLITSELNIEPIAATPKNIEISRRTSKKGNYYFVLNHSGEKVEFTPNPGWKAVLGSDVLEPYGITVYYF